MSFLIPLAIQFLEPYIRDFIFPNNANDQNSQENTMESDNLMGSDYYDDMGLDNQVYSN